MTVVQPLVPFVQEIVLISAMILIIPIAVGTITIMGSLMVMTLALLVVPEI